MSLRARVAAFLDRGAGGLPEPLARRVRLANLLALLACAISLASLPFDLFAAPRWVVVEDLVVVPVYLSVRLLFGRGHHRLARVALVVVTNLLFTATAAVLGERSGQQLLFFAFVAMPFLLFDADEWRVLAACAALPVACYVALALWGFRLTERFVSAPRPEYALYSSLVTFTVLLAGMAYFLRQTTRAARALAERERLLDDLRAKSMFAAKMAALGEMAGGIAHEINNPLTAINLAAARIEVAARKGDAARAGETARHVQAVVGRISKIVSALRFLARDAQGDPFAPATLASIVEQTIELCRDRYREQGIELTVEPLPEVSLECRAVQLSQVLLNLLGNAHDAVESQPEKWVRIAARRLGDEVEVTVSDSGPGVPVDLREKIFQPFFTTKDVGQGTGLGLSVSRGIVEAHRGSLRLADELAHTCFVMRLPLTQPR